MSISNQIDRVGPVILTNLPQGVATTFSFQLPSDLLVLNLGTTGVPIDPATTLALNSDYTVSGGGYDTNNNMQTGTVTLTGAGSNLVVIGDQIVIMRAVPLTQLASATTGPLTGVLVEQALDKTAMIAQQLNEQLGRSLHFENFETLNGILSLAARKNSIMGFDALGQPTFNQGVVLNVGVLSPINTIALLGSVAVAGIAANSIVEVLGYYTPGDGGGGWFYFDPNSVLTANGGTVLLTSLGSVAGRWIRSFSGSLNVRWFGAKGDGVTDDWSFLENAITAAGSTALLWPVGNYITGSILTCAVPGANWFAEGTPRSGVVAQITAKTNTVSPVIQLNSYDFTAKGIVFSGVVQATPSLQNPILIQGGTNTITSADIDARFFDCVFLYAQTAYLSWGRGFYSENCQYTQIGGACMTFNWSPAMVYTGLPPESQVLTGMRAYTVRNSRFHGCVGPCIQTAGTNASNFTGLEFNGNYSDGNEGVFAGSGRNCTFTGNTFINMSGSTPVSAFVITNAEGFTITGNTFAGMYEPGAGNVNRHTYDIQTILTITGTANGIVFNSNVCSYVYQQAILLNGTVSNLSVIGNVFNDILRQNNSSPPPGSNYSVLEVSGGTLAGVTFQKNTIYLLGDWVGAGGTKFLIHNGTTNSNVTMWSVGDNIWNRTLLSDYVEHNFDIDFAQSKDGFSGNQGDNSITVVPGIDFMVQRFNSTLTAARTVTLSHTGAIKGISKFRFVRAGAGAFNLNLSDSGTVKALPASSWCDVMWDGAAWIETAFGSL